MRVKIRGEPEELRRAMSFASSAALHGAALVPLEVLERAAAMNARLEELEVPARFSSDLAVAKALVTAARTGALENVRINLESIEDVAFQAAVEARLHL